MSPKIQPAWYSNSQSFSRTAPSFKILVQLMSWTRIFKEGAARPKLWELEYQTGQIFGDIFEIQESRDLCRILAIFSTLLIWKKKNSDFLILKFGHWISARESRQGNSGKGIPVREFQEGNFDKQILVKEVR